MTGCCWPRAYATNRVVFGRPIAEYELTRTKLARMAIIIQASRQFAYGVADTMALIGVSPS